MGGWIGGQAKYVTIHHADFNLLKFPDRDRAMERIRDLTMLSDILPTGFHGAIKAGVGVDSMVYVAGAGLVGLAAAASARILGAAVVMIGGFNKNASNMPARSASGRSILTRTIASETPSRTLPAAMKPIPPSTQSGSKHAVIPVASSPRSYSIR
jgi:threonine dehydrogenase-like Zn-dependent dehydrogenase